MKYAVFGSGCANTRVDPHFDGQRGQSIIEYLILVMFAMLLLTIGNPSPIQALMTAIRDYYGGYSYAISWSDLPERE